jgi:ribosomal subunit interface protein
MRIKVRGHNVKVTRGLLDFVIRRFQFVLGRFTTQLGTVAVNLAFQTEPNVKEVYSCCLTIDLAHAGRIRIQTTGDDMATAVIRAAERSSQAVSRRLDRQREHRRLGSSTQDALH